MNYFGMQGGYAKFQERFSTNIYREFCMKILLCFIIMVFAALPHLRGQAPLERIEMGASSTMLEGKAKDISNPNSWEETSFLLNEPLAFFGKVSLQTQADFWNNRLYRVRMTFAQRDWAELRDMLRQQYGEPWRMDSLRQEGAWGAVQKGVLTYQSGQDIVVTVYDDVQKDFHWQDLFRGVLLYVVLAIIGLFVCYWLIASLAMSYCSRCRSFGMELQEGVHLSNLKAYHTDTSLFSTPNLEYDKTYTHKCKNCGHVKQSTYSGWWASYRKRT